MNSRKLIVGSSFGAFVLMTAVAGSSSGCLLLAAGAIEASKTSSPPPPPPPPPPETVCESASRYIPQFKQYWVSISPDNTPLPDPPFGADFVAVCNSMPENVQRCMHGYWRAKHESACDAVLLRLEPAQEKRIDALFLAAPAR